MIERESAPRLTIKFIKKKKKNQEEYGCSRRRIRACASSTSSSTDAAAEKGTCHPAGVLDRENGKSSTSNPKSIAKKY